MDKAIILTVESIRTRASTSEALITFALPIENAEALSKFMGMVGLQVGAAFAEVGQPQKVKKTSHARDLKLSSFFRTPKVWKALGTDAEFLEWVRNQPCAFSGGYDVHQDKYGNIVHRNEAAHVRRVANGAGASIKPQYSAIPLRHQHHQTQHNKGESALADPEWWDKKRIETLELWGWERVKDIFCIESMSDMDWEEFRAWCELKGIAAALPASI